MIQISRAPLALGLCMLLSGCSVLGTVLVPAHPDSLAKDKATNDVFFPRGRENDPPPINWTPPKDEPEKQLVSAIAAVALPIIIGAVRKGIEKESERYEATYSGRGSTVMMECIPDSDNAMKAKRILHPWIRFQRKVNVGTKGETAAVTFDMKVVEDGPGIHLLPHRIVVEKTRSKVAWAFDWNALIPSFWITDLVYLPWWLLEKDIAKVDMNFQVTLEALGRDTKGAVQTLSVGSVDFPLGKLDINELPALEQPDPKLTRLASPYLPSPFPPCVDGVPGDAITNKPAVSPKRIHVPVNVVVTVMEANDLGDVIGKGAEKFKESEDDIVSKLAGWLGLEDEEDEAGEKD